jgi:uncharacterized membrane protein
MFDHLYHGSPAWLLALLTAGLVIHVGGGAVAILSGAAALIARKGGGIHRLSGTVFFFAMLAVGTAASALAITAVSRGHLAQIGNVFGGAFAVYLVTTGWRTVHRPPGMTDRADIGGCLTAAIIGVVSLVWLLPIALTPAGKALGVPVASPIILAAFASVLAGLDLKVIVEGGVSGVSRTLRHLWRMCLGMFIATGSFFIGQQKDMPLAIQGSPILYLLGLAPILAMAFWLVQARRVEARKARLALA